MSEKIKTYKAVTKDGCLWWHDGYHWDYQVEGIKADSSVAEGTVLIVTTIII